MIMYDFEYVPKEEWEPIRDELFLLSTDYRKK